MQNTLKVDDEDLLTAEKFMGPTKPVLSNWLAEARDVMVRQRTLMDNMKEMLELMKIEALSDKEKLISIQDRLLKCQEEQLSSMRTTVVTSVQSAVQQEIKSYSAAVKQNSVPALTPDSLQKVVIKAIEGRRIDLLMRRMSELKKRFQKSLRSWTRNRVYQLVE